MSGRLSFVPTNKVRHYWPLIRDEVAKLAALDGGEWMPEDVFNELASPGTYLFTTEGVRGFIITQLLVNPYSRKLHVWLANNVGDVWTRSFFDQIKDIARSNDCTTITFVRNRTSGRIAPGVKAQTLYSVDVGD